MDTVDLPNKPEASAPGSTCPLGANNASASDNCEPSRVVVWCVIRGKFLRPCTDAFSALGECACIPMVNYLNAGLKARTQR